MRALVVNGDDFGLTPGVNAGILDCHVHGILTSASLFANGPATAEAIVIARQTPALGIGCHLTLVDGAPLLPVDHVRSLAPQGIFRPSWRSFVIAALHGGIDFLEVERELAAQIEHLRGCGLTLTHLDAHKHVHAYPPVFAIVARLARRFAIPVVRVPYEAPAFSVFARSSVTKAVVRQAAENLALFPWAAWDRRLLARHGLERPPRFLGRVVTGVMTAANLHALLDGVRPGISELMTHPGHPDSALDQVWTRLRASRAVEVSLLTSSHIHDAVRRAGIVLVRHGGQFQREQHVPQSRTAISA
jgi:predicted glycoside hydrolase/deacetylase ChbG (UPF0249 family)